MRLIYEQVQKRLQTVNYDICTSMEKTSVTSWIKRFVQNAHIYGHQNGKSKPPIQALKRHFPQDFSWKLQQKIRLRLFCYKLLFFQCHWLSISHLDLRSFLGTTPILVLLCHKSHLISKVKFKNSNFLCLLEGRDYSTRTNPFNLPWKFLFSKISNANLLFYANLPKTEEGQ